MTRHLRVVATAGGGSGVVSLAVTVASVLGVATGAVVDHPVCAVTTASWPCGRSALTRNAVATTRTAAKATSATMRLRVCGFDVERTTPVSVVEPAASFGSPRRAVRIGDAWQLDRARELAAERHCERLGHFLAVCKSLRGVPRACTLEPRVDRRRELGFTFDGSGSGSE